MGDVMGVARDWVDSLHRLAWPQRITLLLLGVGGVLNLYVATRPWIEPLWKRSYAYKGVVCLLTATWYVLLIVGSIAATQFVQVTRWLQPCVVFALMISALQHLAERRKLERRRDLQVKLVDQATRVIAEDDARPAQ